MTRRLCILGKVDHSHNKYGSALCRSARYHLFLEISSIGNIHMKYLKESNVVVVTATILLTV